MKVFNIHKTIDHLKILISPSKILENYILDRTRGNKANKFISKIGTKTQANNDFIKYCVFGLLNEIKFELDIRTL